MCSQDGCEYSCAEATEVISFTTGQREKYINNATRSRDDSVFVSPIPAGVHKLADNSGEPSSAFLHCTGLLVVVSACCLMLFAKPLAYHFTVPLFVQVLIIVATRLKSNVQTARSR